MARYDGLADWYDAEFQPSPLESPTWDTVTRLLGRGSGPLLDVGCGTGAFSSALAGLGWTVTDVADLDAMLREIARVLRAGAPFLYVGAHPCFVGPHSEYVEARGVPALHAGWYRASGAYEDAPGRSGAGLRARIGTSFHRQLAELLQAFVDAGLHLERIEEPEERDYPYIIALRWRR